MVGCLLGIMLASLPMIDHSASVGVTSVYMDETFYHGTDFIYDATVIFDTHSWKVTPRQMHFHNKSFVYSLEAGPEVVVGDALLGIKFAYDLTNMSGRTFQQRSIGLEFSNQNIEVSVRHYSPWPAHKLIGGFKVVPYSHIDLDIIHKIGDHKVGFSPYHIDGQIGLKGHAEIVLSTFNLSAQWKYDDLTKHSVMFGISFGILSPKKVSKHSPLIFTKSLAVSTLTPSPISSKPPLSSTSPPSPPEKK